MRVTDKQRESLDKFLADYEAFAAETGDRFQLAEDATTYYALKDVQVLKTCVKFTTEYGGVGSSVHSELIRDSAELDEQIRWWRGCLRRAKRYWCTSSEVLDRMAEGTMEDDTEQDNE